MESKSLEVRMYTRDRSDGLTDLYFLDRTGEPRVVAQLEAGATQVVMEHEAEVHATAPHARPPRNESEGRRVRRWSMSHLLQRAAGEPPPLPPDMPEIPWPPEPPPPLPQTEPPAMNDNMKRRAAREAVRRAVIDAQINTSDDEQMRYELALQAFNGAVAPLEMFEEEAKVRGVAAKALAEAVITDRRRRERRMMHVRAIQAQAMQDLDKATGDGIAAIERHAVSLIRQEQPNAA